MPASRAARLAWRGISIPMISKAGDTIRALIPRIVAVALLDHLNGALEVNAAGRKYVGSCGQTGAANVQERHDFSVVVWDDVGRKTAVRITTTAPGIDHGGHARADAAEVRVHPVAIHTLVHVGMKVN